MPHFGQIPYQRVLQMNFRDVDNTYYNKPRLIVDGGDAECIESGYSYSVTHAVQFNAADLASISSDTRPMNIQWSSHIPDQFFGV